MKFNTLSWLCFSCRYKNGRKFCKTLLVSDVCPNCLKNETSLVVEEIIAIYFLQSYQYKTILRFLAEHHKIKMSLRMLKTRLKQLKLGRRNLMSETTAQQFDTTVLLELLGPSSNSSYTSTWQRLSLIHGLFVPRDAVMLALRQLDPDGSVNRSKRKLKRRQYQNQEPNLCGYDKLKPLGFPIHGCIDGYSRKIMWLKTVHSIMINLS